MIICSICKPSMAELRRWREFTNASRTSHDAKHAPHRSRATICSTMAPRINELLGQGGEFRVGTARDLPQDFVRHFTQHTILRLSSFCKFGNQFVECRNTSVRIIRRFGKIVKGKDGGLSFPRIALSQQTRQDGNAFSRKSEYVSGGAATDHFLFQMEECSKRCASRDICHDWNDVWVLRIKTKDKVRRFHLFTRLTLSLVLILRTQTSF